MNNHTLRTIRIQHWCEKCRAYTAHRMGLMRHADKCIECRPSKPPTLYQPTHEKKGPHQGAPNRRFRRKGG